MQVRWNYHRPEEGDWTPDPIEEKHTVKQLTEHWTFDLNGTTNG